MVIALVMLGLLCGPALGADELKLVATETITVSSSATAFTSGVSNQAHQAVLFFAGDLVRYRIDGTVPTATAGALGQEGDILVLDQTEQITNFKVISDSAATSGATIIVDWYRKR
jgi:hypothetical protein